MNDVERHLMSVMNERLFHNVVTDDFVFVEGLIDEDDVDDEDDDEEDDDNADPFDD